MATYQITEVLTHPVKFACKVSFNGKPAHYYEVDSLEPAVIDATLQKTANDDAVASEVHEEVEERQEEIVVENGKIVVPESDPETP